MGNFSHDFLREASGGVWIGGQTPDNAVGGFSIDTRSLCADDCFVALQTEKRDGHDFLAAAVAKGAAAALVARPVADAALPQLLVGDTAVALRKIAAAHRRRLSAPVFVPVLGVTGSAGKTSVKDLLAAMLGGEAGGALATAGNLNNTLGAPLTLLRADVAQHTAGVVVECGMSEPGEMEIIAAALRPDIALVTNVLPVHLAGVGGLDGVAREKSVLARCLREGGAAVFPAELLRFGAFRELAAAWRGQTGASARRIFTLTFDGETGGETGGEIDAETDARNGAADALPSALRAVFAEMPDGGFRVEFVRENGGAKFPAESLPPDFFMPACTEGMLRNAALASLAATLAGASPAAIRAAAAQWRPSPGRGEIRLDGGRLFYADCYNANPASLLDAARHFDRLTARQKLFPRLFVLGGMNELGAESAALHRQTGRGLPLRDGDTLALFGGDSALLGEGAVAAGFSRDAVFCAGDIEALEAHVGACSAGAVFVKGSRSYALERVLPRC
ncbi:MAG: Mur ligase domain-containing protein [Puniceicoccales bacterium]|jgi:UDP-N-acetylmuramoyl-tripeptide--D-alanyl-D-alanine ligase|nr:Mur ligase domain-containing protein [Puniceicoccales bacterium]